MKRLFPFFAALVLVGCGNNMADDGLTDKDRQAVSRIEAIAKQSGGDWEKVSAADRDYLVKDVSMGSEQSAKMLLQQKAGTLKGGGSSGKRP